MPLEYHTPRENIEREQDPVHSIDLVIDGQLIGRAEMTYYSQPFPLYQLSELYVEHDYQGQGHASAIMSRVESFLIQKKKPGVLVDAIFPDSPAAGMYARRGWREVPGQKSLYVYNLPNSIPIELLRGYADRYTHPMLREHFDHASEQHPHILSKPKPAETESYHSIEDSFFVHLPERIILWLSLINESDIDDDVRIQLTNIVNHLQTLNTAQLNRSQTSVPDLIYSTISQMLRVTYHKHDAINNLFLTLRDDMWDFYREIKPSHYA